MASVRAVAAARHCTRALGDALEVNGGARSRTLGCASTAAHVAWPRRVGPASAATTSHPWRPSPVPQGRSFHRTVDRNDPGAPATLPPHFPRAATHQGCRCVSCAPVAPCRGGPHSAWPGYMCCRACTAESTAPLSTVHLKRIPEGPCAKARLRHGAHRRHGALGARRPSSAALRVNDPRTVSKVVCPRPPRTSRCCLSVPVTVEASTT